MYPTVTIENNYSPPSHRSDACAVATVFQLTVMNKQTQNDGQRNHFCKSLLENP